jgi:ribosomal protein L37AE/L43A
MKLDYVSIIEVIIGSLITAGAIGMIVYFFKQWILKRSIGNIYYCRYCNFGKVKLFKKQNQEVWRCNRCGMQPPGETLNKLNEMQHSQQPPNKTDASV